MNVLIVEDSLPAMIGTALILGKYGFEIDKAVDGKEGVEKGTSEQYDLIAMDIGLPHIDGIEASRQITAAGLNSRIVGLTANLRAQSRETLLGCGMNIAYEKPLTPLIIADIFNRFHWIPTTDEDKFIDQLPGLDTFDDIKTRWEDLPTVESARKKNINQVRQLRDSLETKFSNADWPGLLLETENLHTYASQIGTLRLTLACSWLNHALKSSTVDQEKVKFLFKLMLKSLEEYLSTHNKIYPH